MVSVCDNSKCEYNEVKTTDIFAPFVDVYDDFASRKVRINRHLYKKTTVSCKGDTPRRSCLFLCDICHAAVEVVNPSKC